MERMPVRRGLAVIAAVAAILASSTPAVALDEPGTWTWPVVGPIVDGFSPPDSPFGSGHRGIDIAVAVGSPVVAPAGGTVSFAGPVGGRRFVTIDHGGGLRSTVSFVEDLRVRTGDTVTAGQIVALSGTGHTDAPVPHVHFGVRIGDTYVDPLDYLAPASVTQYIRLAPCCSAA
jgi:murein DD-endopeptidase MepM/ murein hydrolase activator NlpD